MTTTIQIYGRLGRAPEQRTTVAGKAMVTGAMVVELGRDGEMPEWFSLVAFGTRRGPGQARQGRHGAVSGRLTKSAWTGRDGAERAGFSVLVDGIASARTVRPGKPKVRSRDEQGAVSFDDAIPRSEVGHKVKT